MKGFFFESVGVLGGSPELRKKKLGLGPFNKVSKPSFENVLVF